MNFDCFTIKITKPVTIDYVFLNLQINTLGNFFQYRIYDVRSTVMPPRRPHPSRELSKFEVIGGGGKIFKTVNFRSFAVCLFGNACPRVGNRFVIYRRLTHQQTTQVRVINRTSAVLIRVIVRFPRAKRCLNIITRASRCDY